MEILTGNLYFVSDDFFCKDTIFDCKTVLLFQDMFPVVAKYIDGQYIKSGQPVRIADSKLIQELEKMQKR